MHLRLSRPAMAAALALVAIGTSACGRPFKVETAPGFVELDNQEPQYAYRAIAPEGVVMGVRVVPLEDKGDLSFWTRSVTLRFRQMNAYALLETVDVTARDGTPGKELRFGHDEANKPYLYRVRLYVAQDRLFIIEVGGAKEQMDRYKASIDWMLLSVLVKCDAIVSPVLASRTCNRW
jgi:hypothetical protein